MYDNLLEMVIEVLILLLPSLIPHELSPQLIKESQVMSTLAVLPSGLKVKSDHSLFLIFSASL